MSYRPLPTLLFAALLSLCAIDAAAAPGYPSTNVVDVLVGTCTTTGRTQIDPPPLIGKTPRSWNVSGSTTSGSGSATANVEASRDGVAWNVLATVTLTLGTTTTSNGFRDESSYKYYALNCTAISGTGASVSAAVEY